MTSLTEEHNHRSVKIRMVSLTSSEGTSSHTRKGLTLCLVCARRQFVISVRQWNRVAHGVLDRHRADLLSGHRLQHTRQDLDRPRVPQCCTHMLRHAYIRCGAYACIVCVVMRLVFILTEISEKASLLWEAHKRYHSFEFVVTSTEVRLVRIYSLGENKEVFN